MKNYTLLDEAILMATQYHAGQFDKAGLPYVLHPIRVAESLGSERGKIVAVLHDILEDTDCTEETLRGVFSDEIVNAVVAVTKMEKVNGPTESYREYLDRVKSSHLSLTVKLADMEDNSRTDRLASLPLEQRLRLVTKYTRGRHYLCTGEWLDNEYIKGVINYKTAK